MAAWSSAWASQASEWAVPAAWAAREPEPEPVPVPELALALAQEWMGYRGSEWVRDWPALEIASAQWPAPPPASLGCWPRLRSHLRWPYRSLAQTLTGFQATREGKVVRTRGREAPPPFDGEAQLPP